MNFKKLPKVELHVHLDGSLKIDTINELTHYQYSKKELEERLIAKQNCQDLNMYLEKFELPLKLLQTKENLTRVSYELCEELKKENVIYAEIRFAPLLHTKECLNLEEVVIAVLNGLNKSTIKTNLILCLMRGANKNDNLKTIELAKKYLNNGVVGIDLAGAESLYKNELYEDLFRYANELKIPFTIHAGEASNEESIISALNMGAKRIGHGIKAINNEELIKRLKKDKIALEICPTSNINTKAIDNIKNHPIYDLYKQGVLTTINTDNKTVSNTDLIKEYELLLNNFPFKINDIIKMNEYAIECSFLPDKEKNKLHSLYKKELEKINIIK